MPLFPTFTGRPPSLPPSSRNLGGNPAESMESEPPAPAVPEEAGSTAIGVDEDCEPQSESFMCFVCLDLMYKPVVLECGHMSCFWCVHKSMSGIGESSCGVCRRQYKYFPGICELMHRLLLKLEPAAYKRRAKEVLEEENRVGCFSPQLIECLEEELDTNAVGSLSEKPAAFPISNELSVSDVLCCGCKELLVRPSVLNCGHAYCEPCTMGFTNELIKCPTCEMLHPGDLPKVCLQFDEFLEQHFQEQYMQRIMKCDLKVNKSNSSSSCAPAVETPSKNGKGYFFVHDGHLVLDDDYLANAHIGVGCDACGMYPIIGKRYKCKDCKESIGFDLCQACYETPSKRPGRFNQRHTPDHKFEIDDTLMLINILKKRANRDGGQHPESDTEEFLDD